MNISKMFNIEGKVALVTGALGSIGKSYAIALLRQKLKGAALLDINESGANEFIKELENEFGSGCAIFIQTDVADTKEFENAFKQTIERFNQLDIVINNAGICDESDVEKSAKTNFVGTTIGTHLAFETYLPKYKIDVEGAIINTASQVGITAFPGLPVYSATKQGIVSLGRSLGHPTYYQKNNIKILTICPGLTNTNFAKVCGEQARLQPDSTWKKEIKTQSPDYVAESMVGILRKGKSGEIWLVDQGMRPTKINYDDADQSLTKQTFL